MTFLHKLKPGIRPLPDGVSLKDFPILLATWFGAGLVKPGPGTMGTLLAIPPGYAIMHFFGNIGLAIAAVILIFIGIKVSDIFGKKSGENDDQRIVIDEVAGLWIAAIPADTNEALWVAAFIWFRFFDIVKIWPASYFDKRKSGGVDVMMDDVIAGLMAMAFVGSQAFYLL